MKGTEPSRALWIQSGVSRSLTKRCLLYLPNMASAGPGEVRRPPPSKQRLKQAFGGVSVVGRKIVSSGQASATELQSEAECEGSRGEGCFHTSMARRRDFTLRASLGFGRSQTRPASTTHSIGVEAGARWGRMVVNPPAALHGSRAGGTTHHRTWHLPLRAQNSCSEAGAGPLPSRAAVTGLGLISSKHGVATTRHFTTLRRLGKHNKRPSLSFHA